MSVRCASARKWYSLRIVHLAWEWSTKLTKMSRLLTISKNGKRAKGRGAGMFWKSDPCLPSVALPSPLPYVSPTRTHGLHFSCSWTLASATKAPARGASLSHFPVWPASPKSRSYVAGLVVKACAEWPPKVKILTSEKNVGQPDG